MVTGAIIIIALVLCILYNNYKARIKRWISYHVPYQCLFGERETDTEKLYDAFVTFPSEDTDFVENHILKSLGSDYNLHMPHRHFAFGGDVNVLIEKAVENSRRIVIVVSQNFTNCPWTERAFKLADSKSCERTIIILKEEVDTAVLNPQLKDYVKKRKGWCVKWDKPRFWPKLKRALGHPRCNPEQVQH